ncbi:MAG: hypothetical protein O2U62_03720 [Candidatus Bathyarchaeota archaeon]|nr:hypothetical protein [Candidatus Bathyarchaeota archaeon]
MNPIYIDSLGKLKLTEFTEFTKYVLLNHKKREFARPEDEYVVKAATTVREAISLLEAGFQCVATTPQDVMMFRKPK